jgi:hypothetical protein
MDLNQEFIKTISEVVELKPVLVLEEFSSVRPFKTLGLIQIRGVKFRGEKLEKLGLAYIHAPLGIIKFQGGILYPEPSYDIPGMVIDTIKFPKFLFILLDFIIPPLPQNRHQFIIDQLNIINERWKDLPKKVLKPLGATIKFRTGLGIFGIFKSKDKSDLLSAVRNYIELWNDLYRNANYIEDPSLRKDIIKHIAEYRRVGRTYSYDRKLLSFLVDKGWAERFLTDIFF